MDTESPIRCSIESRSETNSKSPLLPVDSTKLDDSSPDSFLMISRSLASARAICLSQNPFADVTAMTIATRSAVSSSSVSCASLAAPTNSRATEKEMDTVRSLPSAENAVLAESMDMPCTLSLVVKSLQLPEVTTSVLSHEIAPSSTVLERVFTCRRRLFVLPLLQRQKAGAVLHTQSCFLERPHSRKRRTRDETLSDGVVMGVLLGELAEFCELDSMTRSIPFLVRKFVGFLGPVADALESISGMDALFLRRGVASRRLFRIQASMMNVKRMSSRVGCYSTVLSAAVSIYLVYSISIDPLLGVRNEITERDAKFLVETDSLTSTCRYTLSLLENILPAAGYAAASGLEMMARDCERRTIERALRGVRVAKRTAERFGLNPLQQMKLELEYFRKAAFPSGQVLNEQTREDVLEKLENHSFYVRTSTLDLPKASVVATHAMARAVENIVPLSELGSVRLSGDGGSSVVSASSVTSASSRSSVVSDSG